MDYSNNSTDELLDILDKMVEAEKLFQAYPYGQLMYAGMLEARDRIAAIRNELFKRGHSKIDR